DEITTTGILNSSAQLWGIFLVAIMDATEDTSQKFSMRVPNWLLFIILCVGVRTIWVIDHSDGKMMSAPAPAPAPTQGELRRQSTISETDDVRIKATVPIRQHWPPEDYKETEEEYLIKHADEYNEFLGRIGISFNNQRTFQQVLTHKSYKHGSVPTNERLTFV
ncbi:985_t:CDS:2, partial [Paraglomus occultum]